MNTSIRGLSTIRLARAKHNETLVPSGWRNGAFRCNGTMTMSPCYKRFIMWPLCVLFYKTIVFILSFARFFIFVFVRDFLILQWCWSFYCSLGPVYEFVCDSFTTGNLNCFRVKWQWRSTWYMCENLNPRRKSWKWPRPETAVST
jgi:hypothetical protein